jgi:hypothetical protein
MAKLPEHRLTLQLLRLIELQESQMVKLQTLRLMTARILHLLLTIQPNKVKV